MNEVVREQERTLRQAQILTRMALVRSTTPMAEGPQEDLIAFLVDAGATDVRYVASPTGRALGFVALGEGQVLANAMADRLTSLVDAATATTFRALAHFNDWQSLRFALVLGAPSWLRAGVRGLATPQVQAALDVEGVPTEEIGRVLAPAQEGIGAALGLDVVTDGERLGLAVPIDVDTLPQGLDPDGASSGSKPLVVEHIVGWPEVTRIVRSGIDAKALIDWQHQQGMGVDAAQGVGTLHGMLNCVGPRTISWQAGQLLDSLTYTYENDLS